MGTAGFAVEGAARSGKIVAELKHISHQFDDQQIIDDFSTVIQRGDRIGIVGANGSGKSTLVKILLGELQPDQGQLELGSKLEIAYSDQLRETLEPDKNLIDNVCGGQDFIEIGGRRRHAISYLGEFLFSPDRVRMPVSALSGGEQNRAVLAKLFSKPANLLVLDEPTNDLDIETLELLEEILLEFEGTVLLVSHDRDFMDNVVTSLIVMDGQGGVSEYVGGYSDWESHGGSLSPPPLSPPVPAASSATRAAKIENRPAGNQQKVGPKRKLSYHEQRELGRLPGQIEALEQQQSLLEEKMSAPGFYESGYQEIQKVMNELAGLQAELEKAYVRWDALEAGE
jgi:ATP-binding cassette subfamily F protein uup